MVQTKTSHLRKVSYAIILLGWRFRGCKCYVTVTIFTVLLYPVWNNQDMNHQTTRKDNNLKCLEVTEVNYKNVWMRSRPIWKVAIHTHKHYWYRIRQKKAYNLYTADIKAHISISKTCSTVDLLDRSKNSISIYL